MKVIETIAGYAHVELTRRNLETLLRKLDEPKSSKTLSMVGAVGNVISVTAVENGEHYGDRDPGPMLNTDTGEIY